MQKARPWPLIRRLRCEISNRIYLALPDSAAVKFAFWRAHGRWPDVANPKSLSEKVQYRKLFVRDEFVCDSFARKTRWM